MVELMVPAAGVLSAFLVQPLLLRRRLDGRTPHGRHRARRAYLH